MARRSLGTPDRIVLDVGGTKFITSSSTLTTNSAYFASLLSDNWIESNNGDDEIFIDQIPSAFSILLDYMRRGNINVDAIDTDVLSLAEFLGMERLLLAIKIRWYCNIGRGPVVNTDDEIAAAFDQEHGGIMKAISSGLFPHFLKQNDVDAEKEFAVLNFSREIDDEPMHTLKEIGNPENPEEHRVYGWAVGALNGLYLKGYTDYESQLKTSEERYTFSRRKHTMGSGATDIFILNKNETVGQGRKGYVKQFAAVIYNEYGTMIQAPADFLEDESQRLIPLHAAIVIDSGSWLEENGFGTRENAYEDIFREFYTNVGQTKFNIFSRVIRKSVDVTW